MCEATGRGEDGDEEKRGRRRAAETAPKSQFVTNALLRRLACTRDKPFGLRHEA